jgi:predicted SprT family Zn-dependent metalloprotease
MNDTNDLSRSARLIRRWARLWNVLMLADEITCQWSPRLRRSLGRAYPQRKLIRLSPLLVQPQYDSVFDEVLCHEAAHIVAYHVHGSRVADHGPAWQELVRVAGHEPRRCLEADSLPKKHEPESVRYVHVCPVCQATRTARRPQPQWRCVACLNAGLEGELLIQSRPMTRESLDV